MQRDANTHWFDRQFMAFVESGRAERKAQGRRRRSRESVTTVMLTTLAASLGAFALAVLVSGLAGHPLARWNEPQTIIARPWERNGMYWYFLPSGAIDASRPGSRVERIDLPSRECIALWLLGLLLTLPLVLRRGFTRSVVLSLALLMPTAVITALILTLLGFGCFPSFTW